MKKISLMAFALALLLFNGIAVAEDTPPTPEEANVWTTEEGVRFYKCPVMKGEGLVEDASAFSVIEGKKYYFCCPGCPGSFRSDPQKWLMELQLPGNIAKVDEQGRKHFRDPVSDEVAIVEENTHYTDYHGYRYFFESKETKKQFDLKHEEYLK
ncbi:MAG: hypothetical protein ABH878_00915 [bacterium]